MKRKIILSRKGFDSSNGGIPSPILENGIMLSLPIPNADDNNEFDKLHYGPRDYWRLIKDLGYLQETKQCHLDPDIYQNIKLRPSDWKACFGQSNVAQLHLQNEKVDIGDIFLFFGWFRETMGMAEKISYIKGSRDIHAIFGYLQIGKIINSESEMHSVAWHPHASLKDEKPNVIYVAANNLLDTDLPGFGTFRFSNDLALTKEGLSRSKWDLPDCIKGKRMSYHNPSSQKEDYFQSAMIGQEFVLNSSMEIEDWVKKIVFDNLVHVQ